MDFHTLLNTAEQNISTSKNKKYYSTSFEPPKKLTKEKKLSDNIKKFLEKQKLEDEEKQRLAREKKSRMLELRDPKIQRKVEKSLKVFKSSKKFYTGDKTLDENTEVTLNAQNDQIDQDDYGFASSTSDIFHQKLMEKYQKFPADNKYSKTTNQKKGKSSGTVEESNETHLKKNGHRERVSKVVKSESSQKSSAKSSHTEKKQLVEKPKAKLRAAPPVDFQELLKLAEKKQHEEILIAVPTKKKEPERLLTSKEKRELEEAEAAKKAKLKPPAPSIPKIPKLGSSSKLGESSKHDKNNNSRREEIKRSNSIDKKNANIKLIDREKLKSTTNSPQPCSSKLRDALIKTEKAKLSNISKVNSNNFKSRDAPVKPCTSTSVKNYLPQKSDKPTSSKDISKTREFPPKDLQKTREFPPKDLQRTREFPPRDLKRPMNDKKVSRHPIPNKRRMYDDDDSEYDSEMDDFIDDGEEEVDVSSAIKSIFGYDKSRYRDEDFDDREMISDYRTVMKEEYISKKIGLLEDLEDMRREAEEIKEKEMRRKMLAKKKKSS